MTILNQISSPPPDEAEVIVNECFETLEHQAVYGKKHSTTTGLTWGYYGGRWGGFSVADGTLSLTASQTNYVVVAIATGAISVSTASTNWDNDTDYVRVYKITTGTSTVSSVEDHRAGPGGVHGGGGGGGGGGAVAAEDVSIADAGGYFTGTDVEAALQELGADVAAAATKRGALIVLAAGYTPSATGADTVEIPVPYSPTNGTTSLTWNVRRLNLRVNVAGGAPSVTVEKSTASTAFSATTVGTVTLASGAYEGSTTSTLGTVASGDKLRMNVAALGTATGWTVTVLLEEQ
jgi:hypothetical protein